MEPHPALLRAHAPVLRRRDGAVQIGVGDAALILRGVTITEARWLARLDGRRTRSQVLADAAAHGLDARQAGRLLTALADSGDLIDSYPRQPVGEASVVVVGAGALPALVASVIASTGLSRAQRLQTDAAPVSADLAILTGSSPPDGTDGAGWARLGVPVLPVTCLASQAWVGPLIQPGTASGPCLRCLDLARSSRDPGWVWLQAQLSSPLVAARPADGDPALRLLTAGLAIEMVTAHLDGRAEARPDGDWSYDLATPGPTMQRHRWGRHPACDRPHAPSLAITPARVA